MSSGEEEAWGGGGNLLEVIDHTHSLCELYLGSERRAMSCEEKAVKASSFLHQTGRNAKKF